jgi:hypothetical protein
LNGFIQYYCRRAAEDGCSVKRSGRPPRTAIDLAQLDILGSTAHQLKMLGFGERGPRGIYATISRADNLPPVIAPVLTDDGSAYKRIGPDRVEQICRQWDKTNSWFAKYGARSYTESFEGILSEAEIEAFLDKGRRFSASLKRFTLASRRLKSKASRQLPELVAILLGNKGSWPSGYEGLERGILHLELSTPAQRHLLNHCPLPAETRRFLEKSLTPLPRGRPRKNRDIV